MIRVTKKIFGILSEKQKHQSVLLIILMLIGGIMESVSVTLILPLIDAVVNEGTWSDTWYANLICNLFGITTQRNYIIVLLVALIAIFVVKNIFLLFEYYIQYGFICRSRFHLQHMLMREYLHKPYEYYLSASSGEIVRVVTADTGQTFSVFNNLIIFYTEIVVAGVVGITIVFISPKMSIGVILILLAEVLIIAKIIKPIMQRVGNVQRSEAAKANKWLLQSINGIKSVKVSHTENFFEEKYVAHANKGVDAERKSQTLANVPRLIIEAFTVSAVLLLVLVMVLCGSELSDLIPQLSAFVVAAMRLLPSINRISNAQNQIPFYEGGLDNVIEVLNSNADNLKQDELDKTNSEDSPNIEFDNTVRFNDVVFSYEGNDRKIFDKASFVINVGESIGIVGTSGAGKTTAIDILLGLLEPDEGNIFCDDIDIKENMDAWLSNVAYIPQNIFLMDDTIKSNIAFGKHNSEIDDNEVWMAIKEAQLEDFVRSLPEGIHTRVGEQGIRLSGGQKQRIGIARALYNNPKLLVFDEATSALDNETEAAIMDSINSLKGQKTMIIIAHRLSTIENCDTVYRVEAGKIIKER